MPALHAEYNIVSMLGLPITLSGYVKADNFTDSRQVVAERDGLLLLYPLPFKPDEFCDDIHKHPRTTMTLLEASMNVRVDGPDIWGAKSYTLVSGNFWGTSQFNVTLYRFWYAFINLQWKNFNILIGQYDHPLATRRCAPRTLSYNYGSPIQAVGVDPMVSLAYLTDHCRLELSALEQASDSYSNGPHGFSSEYIRNAIVPNLNFCAEYIISGETLIGADFDYMRLKPRLVNDEGNHVNESINSFIACAYGTFEQDTWRFCSKIFYAQNGTDQGLISGYAVHSRNPLDGSQTYTNLQAIAAWADFAYFWKTHHQIVPGIFIGGTKNIGSVDALFRDPATGQPIIYDLGAHNAEIDYVFRISPRCEYQRGPYKVAAEVELTRAAFGTILDNGKVVNAIPVNNVRVFLAFYYIF